LTINHSDSHTHSKIWHIVKIMQRVLEPRLKLCWFFTRKNETFAFLNFKSTTSICYKLTRYWRYRRILSSYYDWSTKA